MLIEGQEYPIDKDKDYCRNLCILPFGLPLRVVPITHRELPEELMVTRFNIKVTKNEDDFYSPPEITSRFMLHMKESDIKPTEVHKHHYARPL